MDNIFLSFHMYYCQWEIYCNFYLGSSAQCVFFSLAVLGFVFFCFSFSLLLSSLIIICLGMIFFHWDHWVSWIFKFIVLIRFWLFFTSPKIFCSFPTFLWTSTYTPPETVVLTDTSQDRGRMLFFFFKNIYHLY